MEGTDRARALSEGGQGDIALCPDGGVRAGWQGETEVLSCEFTAAFIAFPTC